MYAVTGATGQLGRLVIDALLRTVEPGRIVAAVRNPGKAADLAARGVAVREADYTRPDTLRSAFEGVERLLLISSSELFSSRTPQHRAAIDAAKEAGVDLIAYTSILHADRSPLKLARDHQETEAYLRQAGIPAVLLRNGWYTENYLMGLKPALEHGAMLGAAGDGRFSLAARADYAEAAAKALVEGRGGEVHELAGDSGVTLAEFAAEVSRQAGKPVAYRNLPQAEYEQALAGAGLPPVLADLLADADAWAAEGALEDGSHALSRLIGRPTTPIGETIAAALKG